MTSTANGSAIQYDMNSLFVSLKKKQTCLVFPDQKSSSQFSILEPVSGGFCGGTDERTSILFGQNIRSKRVNTSKKYHRSLCSYDDVFYSIRDVDSNIN